MKGKKKKTMNMVEIKNKKTRQWKASRWKRRNDKERCWMEVEGEECRMKNIKSGREHRSGRPKWKNKEVEWLIMRWYK